MKKLFIALALLASLACFGITNVATITLAWDASISQDVKHYTVWYDTISGPEKANRVNVGLDCEAAVEIPTGVMYYFHVTCSDWEGRTSGPSNEVATDGIITPDTGTDPVAPGGCYIRSIKE